MRTPFVRLTLAIALLSPCAFIPVGRSMFSRTRCRQSKDKSCVTTFCLITMFLALASIHIQAQNGWTKKTTIPTVRIGASAAVINGKIYVIGGINGPPYYSQFTVNEMYDPVTNTWEQKQPMSTPRGFFACGIVNDTIYAFGGGYSSPMSIGGAYDPVTNTWSTKADMLSPRFCMRAAVVDKIMYIFGGNYNEHNVQAYDPATNLWAEKTPIPSDGGGNLSVTGYGNGLIYTFGGSSNPTWSVPWQPLSTVYEYNPKTDSWAKKRDMPTPRFGFQTYLVNGKIYAIGGSQSRNTSLAAVEVYDPATDTWANKPNMPFDSFDFAGAVVDNKIYVISGSPDWATSDGAIWEFDPSQDPTEIDLDLRVLDGFWLEQNYPNPFNASTTIKYEVPRSSITRLTVFDMLGREVCMLVNERREAGIHEVKFDGSTLSSGVYFYRLHAGDFTQTKRLLLLR